jgi:hypothetical protein
MKFFDHRLYWSISMALPFLVLAGGAEAQTVSFLGQTYQLGSFNQKAAPMWEFVRAGETVQNWTTMLTLVDRPDARTRPDLDRLAQGILDTYKSRGAQVLMARTMVDAAGQPFNYMLVAFHEPAQRRFEINFVKSALGAKNAQIIIYGVRVADAGDYLAKAKSFLKENSGEVGMALERLPMPAVGSLPRREF